jgi:hypothetical protein
MNTQSVTEILQEAINPTTIEEAGGHLLVDLRRLKFKGDWRKDVTDSISLFATGSEFSCVRLNENAVDYTAEQIGRINRTKLHKLMGSGPGNPLVFLYATLGKPNCAVVAVKVYSNLERHLSPGLKQLDRADFKDPKLEAAARKLITVVDEYKKALNIKAMSAVAGK